MSFWLNNQDRWFLWSPVLLGVGIHCYFSGCLMALPWIVGVFMLGVLTLWVCRNGWFAYVGIAILWFGGGAAAAHLKTQWIASQYNRLAVAWKGRITADIQSVDAMEGQIRLLLGNVDSDRRSFHGIRVNFKHKKGDPPLSLIKQLSPGRRIKAYVHLFPVPPRETPLNYDFQFWSFFQGIEAVGFGGVSSIQVKDDLSHEMVGFQQLRHRITQAIRNQNLGQVGEIAIALITGHREGIASAVRDQFAGSGIAHILAISGLHLSLIGGLMFVIFRRGLGMSTTLALHYPLKKIAAVLALLCSFFYFKISGESIPTLRAFIMLSLIMMGIVFDRDPISLRSVALAALLVLGFKPESIYSPSFQMSFAAVSGLIASYEYFRDRSWKLYEQSTITWIKKVTIYVLGTALSSLIASLATLPFIIYTFHRFSWHSIEANIIAIPLMSFWIMPLVIVVLLTLPLGMHVLPLKAMGWGISVLMKLAETIHDLPGSFVPVGIRHELFIILVLVGSLWLLIWTHRLRWLGVPLILLAFVLPKKDIFFLMSQDQSRIGVMAGESVLLTQTGRANFVSQDWKGIVGVKDLEKLSASHSRWIQSTSWGWLIQPFVHDDSLRVGIVVNEDLSRELNEPLVVQGFPIIRTILLHHEPISKGGLALSRDSYGQIHVIRDDINNKQQPWR